MLQESKEFVFRTPVSDPAHQAAIGSFRVANQEQDEKHPGERDEACDDHERIE